MHAAGQSAGVDRTQFGDGVLQRGEVERGRVLDDQQDISVEAPPGRLQGDAVMQRPCGVRSLA